MVVAKAVLLRQGCGPLQHRHAHKRSEEDVFKWSNSSGTSHIHQADESSAQRAAWPLVPNQPGCDPDLERQGSLVRGRRHGRVRGGGAAGAGSSGGRGAAGTPAARQRRRGCDAATRAAVTDKPAGDTY